MTTFIGKDEGLGSILEHICIREHWRSADTIVMLIRAGAVFRVIYCLVRMGMNEEEAGMYKKRARNAVVFYVIAECVWQLKELVVGYY